uniref:Saposin B-type domain-containing protein n=1 Tax=Panagrellus redivivus TaxID=6233 RepID=A0A7E4V353_PANRE
MRVVVGLLLLATCLAPISATENDENDALDADFEKLTKLITTAQRFLTSCSLCRVGGDVIADSAATSHALETLHANCDSTAPALHKFCHAVVDRFFTAALDYAKTVTGKENCAAYCGVNEQPLGNDFFCKAFDGYDEKVNAGLTVLENRVREVCEAEDNQKECMAGFERFKPLITNFLKRTALRVAREIDQDGFCGIDSKSIANSAEVLSLPRFSASEPASCKLCNYLVDSACAMLTGNSGNVQNHVAQYGCFVYKMCLKIVVGTSQCTGNNGAVFDCCDFDNVTPNAQCGQVANLVPIIMPLINQMVWPMACHIMNSECAVSKNPMCVVGST